MLELGNNTEVTVVGMTLPENMTKEEWLQCGERLANAEQSIAWAIGDWLIHGERKFDVKKDVVNELRLSGYPLPKPKACMDAAIVCRAFPTARRRAVSHSHHRECLGLKPHEQDSLLDKAVEEGWSRARIRKEARNLKGLPPPQPKPKKTEASKPKGEPVPVWEPEPEEQEETLEMFKGTPENRKETAYSEIKRGLDWAGFGTCFTPEELVEWIMANEAAKKKVACLQSTLEWLRDFHFELSNAGAYDGN